MKKHLFIGIIVVSSWLTTSPVAIAGKNKIDFEITADFYSKYVWRGQQINDDYVFQTGISAEYKGLTLGVWGNMDTTDYGGNKREFTEWDYSLDYSGSFGDSKVGYSVGVINYHFPSVVGDTTEFYWGLNFDVPLSPYITVYHDIDVIKGIYVNAGISHTFENAVKLSENLSADLELGLSIGWADSDYNRGYWGIDKDGFNDLLFTAALPIDLGGGWSITPSFNYSTVISKSLRDSASFNAASDSFYTGVSISKSF